MRHSGGVRSVLKTQLGGVTTPSAKLVSLALAVAAVILWAFAGWTWWVLLPLLVGGIVVRLLVWLFFEPWKDWAGPVVLAAVIVFLMGWTTFTAHLIAFGVIFLGLAWHLRLSSPKWMRWVALLLGAGLVLGGGLAEFVMWANSRADEQEAYEARHRQWMDQARPDTPQAMMHALIEQVAEPERAVDRRCFEFTPQAARDFALQLTGQPDCTRVFEQLHGEIRDRDAYVNYPWLPAEAVQLNYGGDDQLVRADMCRLEFGNEILEGSVPDAGPQFGVLTMRKSEFEDTAGLTVIKVEPCP